VEGAAEGRSLGELEAYWEAERARPETGTAPATLARLDENPMVTTNDHVPSSMEPYQHSQDVLFRAERSSSGIVHFERTVGFGPSISPALERGPGGGDEQKSGGKDEDV